MSTPSFTCYLPTLRRGQCAIIEAIHASDEAVARLATLGISLGRHIRVLQPGSPCAVVADDTRIVLRGEEAASILLCPMK